VNGLLARAATIAVSLACLSAAPIVAAESQGDEELRDGRRCLSISRIERIEVVDDQTLRFHMRGGQDYLNHLPHRCAGLKSRGTFMHATSTQNYCDLDTITQVDTTIGMRLGSCPLGKFEVYRELEKAE